MKQSESIAALAAALAKAQMQIEPAQKNAANPHFKSHYANLTSIWEACRGPLNANGLSIVQFPCDGDVGRTGLCTMIMHTSGEWISEVVTTRSQKDDPQGLGSALTYLRRYALAAVVGVTATEDDDGNAASRPPAVQPLASRPPALASNDAIAQSIAPRQPKAESASIKSQDEIDYVQAIIEFVKIDNGVGKNGKPYTKFRLGWSSDGERIFGTTFSSSIGANAQRSKLEHLPCLIGYSMGQFGLDVKSIELDKSAGSNDFAEGEDELPF